MAMVDELWSFLRGSWEYVGALKWEKDKNRGGWVRQDRNCAAQWRFWLKIQCPIICGNCLGKSLGS